MHFRALLMTAVMFLHSAALVSVALQHGNPKQWTNAKPEIRRTFPITKFYDTPNPLPTGQPGDRIRKEEFEEYDLSPRVVSVRILYHSHSVTGGDVATSGVVLYPEGIAPAGGWPVIAWAHDLNGVARQCAPSLSRNLEHGPFLAMYVNLGYAVVASDYTGLGTNFRNPFSDMESNATDVIYSIPAAREAVPQLSKHWIAAGIGDGVLAIAGVAELQHEITDQSYLGGILITGLSNLEDSYQQPSLAAFLFLTYGAMTVFPQFEPKDVLTDKGLPMLARAEHVCGDSGLETHLSESGIAKPNWQSNRFVRQYFERNRAGQKPAYAPMLAIGDADPHGKMTDVIARMCKQGDVVQFEKFAASDPGSALGDSVTDQIAWIQGRFAGRPAPNNCSEHH
jgi:hypothetical protein